MRDLTGIVYACLIYIYLCHAWGHDPLSPVLSPDEMAPPFLKRSGREKQSVVLLLCMRAYRARVGGTPSPPCSYIVSLWTLPTPSRGYVTMQREIPQVGVVAEPSPTSPHASLAHFHTTFTSSTSALAHLKFWDGFCLWTWLHPF